MEGCRARVCRAQMELHLQVCHPQAEQVWSWEQTVLGGLTEPEEEVERMNCWEAEASCCSPDWSAAGCRRVWTGRSSQSGPGAHRRYH